MANRIPWSQYEAVLLVEAFFWIENGDVDRSTAVCLISDELRRIAVYKGIEIDDVYRNTNGINMRFYELQYIVSDGKTGMKNTSRLFKETMDLYLHNREEFERALREAKEMIENTDQTSVQFKTWLENKYPHEQSLLLQNTLRVFNALGRKSRIIKQSLLSISDKEELRQLREKVVDQNEFKLQRKKLLNFERLLNEYEAFIKEKKTDVEIVEDEQGSAKTESIDAQVQAKLFCEWLIQSQNLANKSARLYMSSINSLEKYTKRIYGLEGSVYEITDAETIRDILIVLMLDSDFVLDNACGHNRFKSALDKYALYLQSENDGSIPESVVNDDNDIDLAELEEIIKDADVEGISVADISKKTGEGVWLIHKHLKTQQYAVEIPGDIFIHEENIIDLDESADQIEEILENQFAKFGGYTNDAVLYDAASINLRMFLNDNEIDSAEKMYGITRFLFGVRKSKYCFGQDKHIWKTEPLYSMTNAGVLLSYIHNLGGKATRTQCEDYMKNVKLPSRNLNGLLSVASGSQVLLYSSDEYVLSDDIGINKEVLDALKESFDKLFLSTEYVIPREIRNNWFNTLPALHNGLRWSLLLLQEVVKKYLSEYRIITANENQTLDTIRAGFVKEDSMIETFADLVYVRMLEDLTVELPLRISKEELRQKLIDYGMIQGNELIYTMPKALNGSKFAWSSDGDSVLILKK